MDSPLTGALVMCGGRGTRLRPEVTGEKPLVEVGGRPLIAHVLAALGESRIETIYAAVSPSTPETATWLEPTDVQVIETAGEGYIADLSAALDVVGRPVLTVTADLPLLTGEHIDRAIEAADGDSLAVCVPLKTAERVVESVETTLEYDGTTVVPTGLNVVGDGQTNHVVWSAERLALNLNRPADRRRANRWLSDLL